MSPLRTQVNILIFGLFAVVSVVGIFCLKSYLTALDVNREIRGSLNLRDRVWALSSGPHQKSKMEELQALREGLKPVERQMALSNVIQAYASENDKQLRDKITAFLEMENKYVAFLQPQVIYLEKRISYLGVAGLLILVSGLLALRSFLSSQIFWPLRELSAQMVNFLNGHYSYKFSIPSQNEMGNLQATFHSMAQKVLQNMEELKDLDAAKSEFLNIASHELRTPMTSIKGSIGLLTSGAMGQPNSEMLSLLQIAETETDRLIRLINDILDMAKIEARKLPLHPNWISLDSLVEQTVHSLRGLSETAGVPLEIEKLPPLDVYADKDRIQQVLTNFISNAIKFSPPRAIVTVRCRVDDRQQVLFEVVDRGRGISPEDQAHIFQKFRQATNSENPLVKGTGLGLAIAKALVEEHSGRIGVQSHPGQGSVFFFALPKWKLKSQVEHNLEAAEAA